MTKAQLATIQKIKKDIPQFDFYESDNYEIKRFETEEFQYFVSLTVETGMKGDDGTLASVFCRKHRHGFIGKRGGVSIVNDNGKVIRCSVFDFLNKHYRG